MIDMYYQSLTEKKNQKKKKSKKLKNQKIQNSKKIPSVPGQ
jgi:hypothetical protein